MLKVAFHNLGCKVNSYENEKMIQTFAENGYKIVPFDQKADIYVINTCTVTNIADRKSRQMIHRARQLNPDATVVACGCYVEALARRTDNTKDPENTADDPAIDIAVKNSEKTDIVRIVEEYLKTSAGEYGCENRESSLYEHTRAVIKIQDGCDQFCSYCIIPFVRGRVKSREEDDILKEIGKLALEGTKEVVLTGIHLSSYGLDKKEEKTTYNSAAGEGEYTNEALINLIQKTSQIKGIERIRLGSLEPRIITDAFLSRISSVPELCPHFHLSLQSGSDTVLKRMNRHYDTKEYLSKVAKIREYFEHPAITTDVIAGFPGETEEEFETTRKFLEKADLYEVHVFKYSKREGTTAALMPLQLSDREKSQRSRILIADSENRIKRFLKYYENKETEVLFEEEQVINGETYFVGYNREYVKCVCKSEDDLKNRVVKGYIRGCLTDKKERGSVVLVFCI
ncbi:MAG: tRNA (N(6)-L-threonylcarbamoyladenosine(37)-C(2))-methylthiotransferase MtaB [Lachnospiraceae bacterium]|nr:tRNA (N(6)-L-threonylcarbamoyladenosine(37)-C(2))-methylthiotransferase MtaB [Lachnospiraceae bacterium]